MLRYIGLFIVLLSISSLLTAQNASDSLRHSVDSTQRQHAFMIGPMLTTSGLGSLLFYHLIAGPGLHASYQYRKGNRAKFISDAMFMYLYRNNSFSNAMQDAGIRTLDSYGYYWQASVLRNINDGEGDHLMYIGTFIQGKIYDTHQVRDHYQWGISCAQDVWRSVLGLPICFNLKAGIPVLEYTRHYNRSISIARDILAFQYVFTVDWVFYRSKR